MHHSYGKLSCAHSGPSGTGSLSEHKSMIAARSYRAAAGINTPLQPASPNTKRQQQCTPTSFFPCSPWPCSPATCNPQETFITPHPPRPPTASTAATSPTRTTATTSTPSSPHVPSMRTRAKSTITRAASITANARTKISRRPVVEVGFGYNKGSKYDNGYGHLRAYNQHVDVGAIEAFAAGLAEDPDIERFQFLASPPAEESGAGEGEERRV
ncbi:hypothetical protein FN846DRAFT_526904 [Sphaerosporella brunnea]|uniref:Uncharacterized protein n=1 Tax=Sphaerosporella brunnea TaxID=1250544 RepID=A0A5J5F3B7_9PEZI|nr:hypothetical protein FN846DRAFT_526904 [Sphaerosporella brunnea]